MLCSTLYIRMSLYLYQSFQPNFLRRKDSFLVTINLRSGHTKLE